MCLVFFFPEIFADDLQEDSTSSIHLLHTNIVIIANSTKVETQNFSKLRQEVRDHEHKNVYTLEFKILLDEFNYIKFEDKMINNN